MQGPSQEPVNTAISYRITTLEEEIRSLRGQFDRYVTTRENELQLQSMRDSLRRIENDMSVIKQQMQEAEKSAKEQEKAAKERDVAQQQSQSQIIIKVLIGILSTIGGLAITVAAALIIYFLTHLPTTP